MILTVYGTETRCASCVQAPSSKATAEWLQAALLRKFGSEIMIRYVPIEQPENEEDRQFCARILADEFFYPLLVSGETIIGEGYIELKQVVQYLINNGIQARIESK